MGIIPYSFLEIVFGVPVHLQTRGSLRFWSSGVLKIIDLKPAHGNPELVTKKKEPPPRDPLRYLGRRAPRQRLR